MIDKKVEYYDSCPNCFAPREEGHIICSYCGTTLIKSEHLIEEEPGLMGAESGKQDSSRKFKQKISIVLILVALIILSVIPLAVTLYLDHSTSPDEASLQQESLSKVQEVSRELSDSAKKTREELLGMGFPEDIMEDLMEEDILSCTDSLQVLVQEDHLPYAGLTLAAVFNLRDPDYSLDMRVVQDIPKLHHRTVAVELNRESRFGEKYWILIHYFNWEGEVTFYGTEAINMKPVFFTLYSSQNRKVTGRLLYDDKDVVRFGEYNYITEVTSTGRKLNHKDIDYSEKKKHFIGEYDGVIYAEYDFPGKCTRPRGYIAYGVRQSGSESSMDAEVFYIHQRKAIPGPHDNALQVWIDGSEMADPNTQAGDNFVAEEMLFEIE